MPDYKQMYLTMLDACENALKVLTEAEQKCEDIYVETSDDEIIEQE